jgi:hypothetical protein
LTSPTIAGQAAFAGSAVTTTAPSGQQFAQFVGAQVQVAAVASGVATQYWIELVAYPPGSARSLWLLVGGSWKRLDNPSASIQDTVQQAFLGSGSNVRVWYDGEPIVGLVVEGT